MRVRRPRIGWLVMVILASAVLIAAYGHKHYDLKGKRVAFLVAPSISQSQFVSCRDYLKDCGATVTIVGLKAGGVPFYISPASASVTVDRLVQELTVDDFDAIVIPGGSGTAALYADENVLALVGSAAVAGKVVVAMGDGPVVLDRAGALINRTATVDEDLTRMVKQAGKLTRALVQCDGNIITARRQASGLDVAKQAARVLAEGR